MPTSLSLISDATSDNSDLDPTEALGDTIPVLKPTLQLTAFGMPIKLDDDQFSEFANKTIEFVSNTGIKTHYFIIGDYISNPDTFGFCDPNKGEGGVSALISDWLNQLPDDVNAGVIAYMNPANAMKLDNPGKTADPSHKKYNYDHNVTIGDGSDGYPKDNARQVFELINNINNNSATKKQITHFHFDHEGGGDFQNDSYKVPDGEPDAGKEIPSIYGGVNGDRIGVGYLKWLWNEFMPEDVTFTHLEAANDDFRGHYQLGWTNYRVEAWAENSSGSIENHAENYWFGELEYEPTEYSADMEWTVADVFTQDPADPTKLILNHELAYNLPTIIEAKGDDPSVTFDPDGHIVAGGNTLDAFGEKNGNEVVSPQAVNSVYRYYRDYPEALAYMFSDARYNDLYKPGEKSDKAWGAPLLNDPVYYQALDPEGFDPKAKLYKQPAGAIPTFSFENISSTNQELVKADPRMDNVEPQDSIISAVATAAQIAEWGNNKFGGTFDGLSALTYANFIKFLNAAAEEIAGAPGSDMQAEDVTIALYESTFLPDAWVDKTWVNGTLVEGTTGDDTINGGDGNQTIAGKAGDDQIAGGDGYDVLSGSGGADTFRFDALTDSEPGALRDVITDFDGEEGDLIDLSNISVNFNYIGSDQFNGFHNEVRFEDGLLQLGLGGQVSSRGNEVAMEIELPGVTSFSSDYLIM